MQQFVFSLIVGLLVLVGSTEEATLAQEKNLTFEEVHKNPAAYKGKKITWDGKFEGLFNSRVVFVGNHDRKGAGKTEVWKVFAVDFPEGNDALKAAGGGKVTGIIEGEEVTVTAQVLEGKGGEEVKAPLIKLISFEPTKK